MSIIVADNLKKEVVKLQLDYDELRLEIDSLLIDESKKAKHRIIGAFTSAGALVENILLWIIKNENRERSVQNLEGRQGLFEYRKVLQDIIPKQQVIHVNTIAQWRNLVAHANEIDKVDAHEILTVNSALKSFVKWFFKEYLGNTFSKEDTSQLIIERKTGLHFAFDLRRYKIKMSKRDMFTTVLALTILLTVIIFVTSLDADDVIENKIVRRERNSEEIYNLLQKYYNSTINKSFVAHDFFARKINQFYLQKNLNPTQVDIVRKTELDYIDRINLVDKSSLMLFSQTDSISYWRFWNDFSCYRTTRKKYQTCRVLTEFGFNREDKITSIKEIKITDLKFTKKKPD